VISPPRDGTAPPVPRPSISATFAALWVSVAIFSGVVASVASALGAGWIGDRFDRRRVLIGSDVAAAAVSLAMAATAKQAAALVVLIGVSSIAQSPSSRRRPRRYRPSCPRKSSYAGGSPAPLLLPRAAAAHAFRHTW
jgi:MFS family permease